MRARYKTGSVVFDKRRGTWNFLQWVDGKRRSQIIGTKQKFPTKTAAWREAEKLRLPLEKPIHDANTVNAMATRYEAERFPSRRSTARVYRSWLHNYVLPEWGNKSLSEVQPRPVELWLRSLPLSPKSKSHVRNMLYMLMDFAMWCGAMQIARNPIELVVVKGATKRTRKPRSLTVQQFQRLSTELKEPFRTIALMCVCFGLRISECLALRWSDVNWMNGKLRIERGIVEQNVDDVKTDGSRRSLTVANELMQRLKLWKQTTQFPGDGDWVFASPSKIGRLPYSYTGVWRELQRAAEAAGIGKLGTHSFRHTYRSWLDAVGTPIAVQQKLMRHSDIRTTMNIYGDIVTNEMALASSKVAGLALPSAKWIAIGSQVRVSR
jgi:integrase